MGLSDFPSHLTYPPATTYVSDCNGMKPPVWQGYLNTGVTAAVDGKVTVS